MKRSGNTRKRKRKNRRIARRRLITLSLFTPFLCLLVFAGWQLKNTVFGAIETGEQPVPQTTATSAPATTTTTHPTIPVSLPLSSPRVVVYDVTHSALLFSQNSEQRCSPASLTKLLTAIIATEECEPGEIFTAGSELSFVQPGSSLAHIKSGYKLTRDMIIDALLLASGNDAAYTIAAHVGRKLLNNPDAGDIEALFAFSDKMNSKAQQLGAVNSHFSNPDGYFAADHYTTASDMLKIALAAIKHDNIRQTVARQQASHTLVSGQKLTFKNTNFLLNPSTPFYFEGATGIKTGKTDESGHCVIASAKRGGIEIFAVVMGNPTDNGRWNDAVALLNQAFAACAGLD